MVVVPHRADRSVRVTTRSRQAGSELSNEELILASPVLFGFSLSDKLWRKQTNRARNSCH